MLNPGDIIGGRYQIIKRLGGGAFGQTYLARDRQQPGFPKCVVKELQLRISNPLLLEDAQNRFATEGMILERLGHHPHIPQLWAHFQEHEEFYLVQEFIDGQDLGKEIKRQLFSEKKAIALLHNVLEILDFIHQHDVIHRDLKPSNLMRRKSDGKIVLIDFGAVKEIGTFSIQAQGETGYTKVIGTLGYMPPEQHRGRPVFSSDIYALGRTAIYALTGRSLNENEDPQTGELVNWQQWVQVSQTLAAILEKMIRPRYLERYHSAAEVLQDLQPLLKIGQTLGTRYRITRHLGGGRLGHTYLAHNLSQDNQPPCVIKQIKPQTTDSSTLEEAKRRFSTESTVLERLAHHAQIPQIWDRFYKNGEFYLVEEFIDGADFEQELRRRRLSETEAIALLQDVLEILENVHQQGVIHRDIKPSNLIRRRSDGKMVLIDFGALKEIGTLSVDPQGQTICTDVIGTPGYISPEQNNGEPVYSSDIYGLGRTAIYALTGRSPIELEDAQTAELLNWQEFAQVSQKLAAILDKMVRPQSAERYQGTAEILHALKPLLKIGQTLGGRYKITCYLGGGRLGHTYLANNLSQDNQSPCVIKQINSITTDSSELTVLERLGPHPQIPKLWDHFLENEEFYLVREFIDGQSISQELQQSSLSEKTVLTLLQDVLEILDFIHKHRVIHGNIKPNNLIKRSSDGKIVLIDFEVVKEIVKKPLEGSSTQESYMPPEQMEGRSTFASDIYALGMTAIQALTYPNQFQRNPQTGEVIWQEGALFSDKLARILDKMVRLDRKKRYQGAAEVLKALKRAKRPSVSKWYWYILAILAIILAMPSGVLIRNVERAFFFFDQGDTELSSQNYQSAINNYDQGLTKAPSFLFLRALLNFDKALLNKAVALSHLKRYEEMLQACEEALELKNRVYGWICKGSALDGLKEYEQAIDAYNEAKKIDPNSFEAWHNLGQAYQKIGKIEEAIAGFKKAIEIGEERSYITWNDLGRLYYQLKEYQKAIDAYNQAIRIKPDYIPALIGRGNVQNYLQEYEDAIESFKGATEIESKSYEAWYGKGLAHEGLKQYEEAIKSYKKAIYIKQGDYPAAEHRLQLLERRLGR
ncbi:MAG: protein kinase [Xenococcaceae cyanobacterium]